MTTMLIVIVKWLLIAWEATRIDPEPYSLLDWALSIIVWIAGAITLCVVYACAEGWL